MDNTYRYYNEEWNRKQTTESNPIIPRVDGCIEGTSTGEE